MSFDKATKCSLGAWLILWAIPAAVLSLPWSAWFKDPNLAAWVQAFGSLFAVIATGAAVVLQQWLARRAAQVERLSDQLQRVNSGRRLIAASTHVARKVRSSLLDQRSPVTPLERTLMEQELRAVADSLVAIDVGRFVDWRHVECVTVALACARAIADMISGPDFSLANSGEIVGHVEQSIRHLEQRECLMAEHLVAVGFKDF